MAKNIAGQYEFDIKLTQEEWHQLLRDAPDNGKVIVARVVLGPGWRRECPGRAGKRCVGDDVQPIGLRNLHTEKMEHPTTRKLVHVVRDQPECSKCR